MRNSFTNTILILVLLFSISLAFADTITSFPFQESFDDVTFPPNGWTNQFIQGTTLPGLWVPFTTGIYPTCLPHSGSGMASFNAYDIVAGGIAILSTPPMNIPENCNISFWMYRDFYYLYNSDIFSDEGVSIWYGTSPSDTTLATKLSFIPREGEFAPTVPADGWYQYIIPLGEGSEGDGKYVILNAKSQAGNNIFIDDFRVIQRDTQPLPAIIDTPANHATAIVLNTSLNWTPDIAGPIVTGYNIYFGTDNPPTNMVNGTDVGLLTTYSPEGLVLNEHYYWKVVPYNSIGNATNCPIWDFYSMCIPQPVSTYSPTDGATNVAKNISLTWDAVSSATSYDVYFGESLPLTPNANVTTLSWTPPLMNALTAYSWKIVPKNEYGIADNCPTWTFTTGSQLTYAPSYATNTENDDIGQFALGSFTNPETAPSPLDFNPLAINTYSDFTGMMINVVQGNTYNVSILEFNLYSLNSCHAAIYIDYNQNGTFDLPNELVFLGNTDTYVNPIIGTITIPYCNVGNTRLRVILEEGTEDPTPTGSYYWGETEDYTIHIDPPLPPEIVLLTPTDSETNVALNPTLSWEMHMYVGSELHYEIQLGTDNPPTNVFDRMDWGTCTTYTTECAILNYGTRYYWQIVAYDENEEPIVSSIIGQFNTIPDYTVTEFPYYQNFDSGDFSSIGWTNTINSGTQDWEITTTGTNPTCLPYSGSNMVCYNSYDASEGSSALLITPPLSLDSEFYVSFWFYRDGTNYLDLADLVNVYCNGFPGLDGTPTLMGTVNRSIDLPPVVTNPGWYKYSFSFPYESLGYSRYIIFEAVSEYGNAMYMDDVKVYGPAAPPPPTYSNLVLPVTQIGGSSSDFIMLSNPWAGNVTGTISYSPGLSGPSSFNQSDPGTMNVEVTYTPTVPGLFTGTVSFVSNHGNFTSTVTSNAGEYAVGWETVPNGWASYSLDGYSYWGWYANTHTGTHCVGVSHNPSGNNDWLVSPLVEIAAGDKITFYAESIDAGYPEALKVLISATGNTPDDFSTVVLDIPAVPNIYTGYEIDLSAYVGQRVYIAYVDYSVDSWYLMVDDMGMPGLAMPEIPTNVTVVPTPIGPTVIWDAIPGASSYRLYTSTDPNATPELWTFLAETFINQYEDSDQADKRFYKVTAVNDSKSTRSSLHTLKPQTILSSKPKHKQKH